jgi:hypothetical protein
MNEIAKLSSRVWHPKAVKNEVVQPTMVVPNLRELRPETPAEAEAFARRAQAFSEANAAVRRISPFATAAPKPPIVGEQLSNDSIRAQVASLSDIIAQIRPRQLQPLTIDSIAPLSGFNQLAHDRIAAIPQDKMGQILCSGIPQQKTLFLQRPLSSTSLARDGAPQNKLQLEEIFHAVQSPDGTATTLGRTLINNEWYHFGTNSGTSPLQQASTWIAPTRLLTSQNPAQEKNLSADRVLRDVQGLFKGPWNPYLKGAGLLNKPHTVDIRHADKDGIKSILATLNTITGTLETIQSVTKGIQQGLEFIGMLGSLGDLGKYMQIFNQMKLPGTPGELITALITGKGINPNKPPAPPTADQTGSGKNGVLVTKGGAAAEAMGDGLLAKAEAEKKKAEEEKKKAEAEKKKAEEEKKKAEAEKKKAEEEKKKAEEEKKKAEEEKRKAESNTTNGAPTSTSQPNPTPSEAPSIQQSSKSGDPIPQPAPTPTIDETKTRIPVCPSTRDEAKASDDFCFQNPKSDEHCGLEDYRSIRNDAQGGQQCIYNKDGSLNTTPECAGTVDESGFAEGKNVDGTCNNDYIDLLQHSVNDYGKYKYDPERYIKLQQEMRNNGVPSGTGPTAKYPNGITDAELEEETRKANESIAN